MLDAEISRLRSSPDPLIRELEAAGAKFRGRACNCVWHDDQHASAGIYEKNGTWRFKCQVCGVGGDIIDMMAKVQGKTAAEILKGLGGSPTGPRQGPKPPEDDCPAPDLPASPPPRSYASLDEAKAQLRPVASYVYTNPATNAPEMYVFRIQPQGEHKRFLQGSPGPNGSIILKAPEKPWPIYNRKRVANATNIIVVEGCKAVHAIEDVLRALGVADTAATTSPGGAGKGEHADWTPLAGKRVYLWPDNDPINDKGVSVGAEHMRQVQKILEALNPAPLLYWIDPALFDLPAKGDAYEFCERYPTQEEKLEHLRAAMSLADPLGASAAVKVLFDDVIAGRVETVHLPWKEMNGLTRALKPGTITMLCGDRGGAKSLALLQAAQHWHFDLGHKVAIYELEDDRKYHLTRALVQRTGEMGLLDDEWVKNNSERAHQLWHDNSEFMDLFGRLIYEAPTKAVPIMALAQWVNDRAAEGTRIICLDPITMARVSVNMFLDHQEFMCAVKPAIVKHGCSLVVVTHPKKGANRSVGMDDLAGGSCWQNFSHTVLWLKFPSKKEQDARIMSPMGSVPADCNRVMAMLKTRNGEGQGSNIAMRLNSFKLDELGVMVKE